MKTNYRQTKLRALILLIICNVLVLDCTKTSVHSGILVNIQEQINPELIKTGPDVTIDVIKYKNNRAINMIINGKNPVPKVTFIKGQDQWDISRFRYIAADITNPGTNDLFIELRMNEYDRSSYTQFYGWIAGGQIIPAGKTRTVRTYIQRTNEYPSYLDEKFYGMDALPGGIVKSFWWATLPPDSVRYISVVVINPPEGSRIIISNIRGEDSINPPSESELANNYFPFVDEFGQFKHKEWPGKIHSLDELVKSKEIEENDLIENPGPKQWDKYGGWLNGPQLNASGHFRTEKINGKWWLVDPDGRLFWSHGIGSVEAGGATPITDREHYFADLPDSVQFRQFYGRSGPSFPKGYYKDQNKIIRTFRSFAWNLFRKYGDDWNNHFQDLMHIRFKSWGMNTIGTGSQVAGHIPYGSLLSTGRARRIEASTGAWGKFPDPFDKSFPEAIISRLSRNEESINDSYNIGYFVDNELGWGNATYITKAILQSPEDQPAKQVMLDFLKKKYVSVDALNLAWQTDYKSWKDFMGSKYLPNIETEDARIFSSMVADKYFSTIDETLSKYAPGKLYLGCRFDFHYYPSEDTSCNWAVKIAAKYCDIISFNRYRYSAEDVKVANADVPVMLTEWHMGALDRGMLHFSLRFAENQNNRAEMYTYYVKSGLQNPYCVGSHWFCYVDQPLLGRPDGENLNAGFLDHCDVPYPEMVDAARKIGDEMYELRWK
jgi:hypothetical protein